MHMKTETSIYKTVEQVNNKQNVVRVIRTYVYNKPFEQRKSSGFDITTRKIEISLLLFIIVSTSYESQ